MNIERYIYLGDIHGSMKFKDFIKKYDDGKTFFYSLGDLFDRGHFSYENFLIIKRLHQEGKMEVVLGNHDLFFILSKGLKYNGKIKDYIINKKKEDIIKYNFIKNYYSNFYYEVGGYQTDQSFERNTINQNESKERMIEVSDYLWENFNIYHIDKNNNLLIHGGIPVLPSGDLVHTVVDNEFIGGIELIKKANEGFKTLDLEKMDLLDTCQSKEIDPYHNILTNMLRFQKNLITKDIYNFYGPRHTSPIRFDSSMYDKNEKVRNTAIKEMNDNNINNLFVGHWRNQEAVNFDFYDINSKYWKNNVIYRLDRSNVILKDKKIGTLGYAIFNKNNKLIEVNDF